MSEPLRVVVADDHPPTRTGVREALEKESCAVVAEAATAEEAIAAAREHTPDVCLLDINMPGSGIAAAAEITHTVPDVAVVMLTASRDDEDLFAALRAGASGYLLKDMDPGRIGPALRGVLAGEAILPRWLVLKVVDQFRATPRRRIVLPNRSRAAELTEREAEILDLMAGGRTTQEIADRLFLAPVTVRTHISAILKKLRVPDRKAAIRLARGVHE
ncbi:MAG TPA: response regulator transcription factor [Blastococcus sp.]|nr:response regulator transcription factor [Blastococcus sp.]